MDQVIKKRYKVGTVPLDREDVAMRNAIGLRPTLMVWALVHVGALRPADSDWAPQR